MQGSRLTLVALGVGVLVHALSPVFVAQDQATKGEWSGVVDWKEYLKPGPYSATEHEEEIAHAVLLATGQHKGKVLFWIRYEPTVYTRTWMIAPDRPNTAFRVDQTVTTNIFCAGHALMPDGRLFVAGGFSDGEGQATRDAYTFDPILLGSTDLGEEGIGDEIVETDPNNLPWVALDDMRQRRYYPTAIALLKRALSTPSGWSTSAASMFVVGGPPAINNVGQESWEVFDSTSSDWRPELLEDGNPLGSPPTEDYDRLPTADPPQYELDSYPRALQLSNGDIVLAGDVNTVMNTVQFPPPTDSRQTWVVRPPENSSSKWALWMSAAMEVERYYGNAVLLHTKGSFGTDRVLVFGGRDYGYSGASGLPSSSVQQYVPAPQPTNSSWDDKADMLHPRLYSNAVVLPTGKIFIVGGTAGDPNKEDAVYEPELYDPDVDNGFGATSAMAIPPDEDDPSGDPDSPTPRLYHNVALLLPDGRVFVAGGDQRLTPNGSELVPDGPPSQYTGEFYKPPYFFQGSRPLISQYPNNAELSSESQEEEFDLWVRVYQGDSLDGIVLLRPGTITHHFDTTQRYIELEQEVITQGIIQGTSYVEYQLDVTSPHENLGPPGHYLLFALSETSNGDRVPSVGEFVKFQ